MKKILYGSPVIDRINIGPDKGLPPVLSGEKVHFFGYARTALLEGLRCLGIKENDEVIIPSYICNVVKSPLNFLKVKTRYYRVNPDLSPDKNDILSAINPRTKAVMGVNYFGFPASHDIFLDICKKYSLFYIEDNAHGLYSRYKGRELGTFGDIAIFSMRKTLPTPNGAALVINNKNINIKSSINLAGSLEIVFWSRQINLILERYTGINAIGAIKRMFGKKTDYQSLEEPIEEENNVKKYFKRISPVTMRILKRSDRKALTDIRRKAFKYWLNKLPYGRPLLENLEDGVVPYAFPVITDNREEFVSKMFSGYKVQTFTWPTLPSDIGPVPAHYKKIVLIPLWREYGN